MTSAPRLTPTERILLASTRLPDDPEAAVSLDAVLDEPLDWEHVLRRAREEGTAALLHAHVVARPRTAARVPAFATAALAAAAEATWARNVVLTARWREAVTALGSCGVSALTLKGIALVHTCYPSLALRPMADIDLLVRVEDVGHARDALLAIGYRIPPGRGAATRYEHFVRDGAVIDLHWDLADYPRVARVLAVDHAGVWRRAVPLTIGDTAASTLSPEDCVVYLALHLTLGSEFGRLVWFTDLAAVIRRFETTIDWSVVVEEARRWRSAGVLGHTLGIAASALGVRVPDGVVRALSPGGTRARLAARLVDDRVPPSLRGAVAAPRAYVAETLLLDSLADVARSIATTLFPPRAWLRAHYTATTRWAIARRRLGHPVRVCRLALASLAGFHHR